MACSKQQFHSRKSSEELGGGDGGGHKFCQHLIVFLQTAGFKTATSVLHSMSRLIIKLVYIYASNEDADQSCASAQSDQRLCCSESESESELLLVTRSNDNHSPGPVMREVSP